MLNYKLMQIYFLIFILLIIIFIISIFFLERTKRLLKIEKNIISSDFSELKVIHNNTLEKLKLADKEIFEISRNYTIAETNATRIPKLESQIDELHQKINLYSQKNVILETKLSKEKESYDHQIKMFEFIKNKMIDTFKILSSDALKINNEEFIKLCYSQLKSFQENTKDDFNDCKTKISGMILPIENHLKAFDLKVNNIEKDRLETYSQLREQITNLVHAQTTLFQETQKLSSVLKSSSSLAGKWGELQLKRIVELSGMVKYCDFDEQVSFNNHDSIQKPDMIIHLPGNRKIVVDAKAPTSSYLKAMEEKYDHDRRNLLLKNYVINIRKVISELSKKSYWKLVNSPEFVILFLPGESFFSVALEHDPLLIEDSFRDGVLLATPTTLLGLLKSIAYGWRNQAITENTRDISDIGKKLFNRLSNLAKNFSLMGRSLENTIKNYNKTLGTFENSVLISARKLKDKHIVSEEIDIENPLSLETSVNQITKKELHSIYDDEN